MFSNFIFHGEAIFGLVKLYLKYSNISQVPFDAALVRIKGSFFPVFFNWIDVVGE